MIQSKILKNVAISLVCAASFASGAAYAGPIAVGTTYSFNLTSTSSFGAGTLATVTLVQTTANKVDVQVALANSAYSFASTGVGPTFVFNLPTAYSSANVALTGVSNTSGMFSVLPYSAPSTGDYNMTPDGIFTNAIGLSSTGSSAKYGTPLTFSVTGTGSSFSLTDFSTSTPRNNGQQGGYEFALDMAIGNQTGSVAFFGTTPTLITPPGTTGGNGGQVPEPASLALMGLGLLGLAARRMRK